MKQQNQKAVTVRFTMKDYLEMVHEAEIKKLSTADVVRQAWASYQAHQNIEHLLFKLEQRILTSTFEICAATVGLSENERKTATRQVNTALGREVVR
ncbi:hypothetical protein J2Y65_003736 [Aeromonas salmonicida]|uniref:hypothetical protein n=1 Tax=Aeromonas salmonicida TaxID=645 RepID=UPI00285819CE|nr:hypothetical protein [Aeromonas salmonicida]MDR6997024.1 hypothetical protein [Aeromonas salmonicida]